MKRFCLLLSALCCLLPGCAPGAGEAGLECNVGVMEITPEDGVVLAGFAARRGLSEGVHRPLKTRCLVFRLDTVRVCVVSSDMMETSISFSDELRLRISERTGIPRGNIFLHNTHTHSAPRTTGDAAEPGGPNEAFKRKFAERLVENAVRTACDGKGFRPFTIEAGHITSDINCNRREEAGPIDHDLYAARLLDRRGDVIVSLLNFACHPVSLDHRSLVVSPDFPGVASEVLEREWGAPVFYFNGAAGNVAPCGALRADTAYTNRRGGELAAAALGIEFRALPPKGILALRNREVRLPFSIPHITAGDIDRHAALISGRTGVSATWPGDVEAWRGLIRNRLAAGEVKDHLPVEIAAVDIGGLVLLFSQGEPFNEYQVAARESLPGVPLLFVAYTNGQNSYLPSAHAYASRGYTYEKEQMHVYIKAPWPLARSMPRVYGAAIEDILKNLKHNE